MTTSVPSCLACRVVAGEGEILARAPGLVLHPVAGPSPVPGWVVLTSERHVRALYDLDEPTARELGAFAARVMRAQREVLGAEHAYAFAIGDVLQHFHLHLVPRFNGTPRKWWGRAVFDCPPEEALGPGALAPAAARLASALGGPSTS